MSSEKVNAMPHVSTPYDGKIGVFHFAGKFVAENTIAELLGNLRLNAPNVTSIWIKTSDGTDWMVPAILNKPDLAIRGTDDVARWIESARALGYEVHAWCYLYGRAPLAEADLVAQACNVPGLKSMLLDVEDGPGRLNYKGGPQGVTQFIERLRSLIPSDFHLGLNIMPIGNHPRDSHIAQWLPHINSIHPMSYHKDFRMTPTAMIRETYAALQKFQKPIIPALQAYSLGPRHREVLEVANVALDEFHAPGLSLFRLGDSMTPAYYPFVRQIQVPQPPAVPQDVPPVVILPPPLPAEIDTFEFTCEQLKDAFTIVAQYLGRDLGAMLDSAGLADLDLRLAEKYRGLPVEHLPGLEADVKVLIDSALNGALLPPRNVQPVEQQFEFSRRQLREAFNAVARILNRDPGEMLTSAGLAGLDSRPDDPYIGLPVENLPGLQSDVKALILSAINGEPLPDIDNRPVEEQFEFTCRDVKAAFETAAGWLGRDPRALLALAGLGDLDSRLDQNYSGYAIPDLPGLSLFAKTMIDTALNQGDPPDPAIGNIAGKLTNQRVINRFQDAAIALDQSEMYWNWVVAAGLQSMADSQATRRAPYSGPRITDLPNLTSEIKLALLWVIELKGFEPIPVQPGQPPPPPPGQPVPPPLLIPGDFLPVPWVSQLDHEPPLFEACGPTSILMLGLAYNNTSIRTLDEMTPITGTGGQTGRGTLITAGNTHLGLSLSRLPDFATRSEMISRIRELLGLRRPVIVLLNYNKLLTDLPFANNKSSLGDSTPGGETRHWWIVIGAGAGTFVVNDPLWRRARNPPNGGAAIVLSEAKMTEALHPLGGVFLAFAPTNALP